MRFGIITPVFDGCLESLELLHKELTDQTHKKWIWMLCSNGFSEKISKFIEKKNSLRSKIFASFGIETCHLVYVYTKYEKTKNLYDLLKNLGMRRNFCLNQINADYVFMIDADAKILDEKMFQIIDSKLEKNRKNICIYKIFHKRARRGKILPIFPIEYGDIDALNFCVKASFAKTIGYPTSINREMIGNDYWYFKRAYDASEGDYLFIDKIFGEHNGNNRYECVLDLLKKETHKA